MTKIEDTNRGTPRILVKAPNWVGDCVMSTPAIRCLRATFPQSAIDVLARPSVAGVLLDNPDITEVVAADERRMERATLLELQSRRYDAVALMPNSLGAAWNAWMLRIPHRVGFSRNGRGMLLTTRIPFAAGEWQTTTPQAISRKSLGSSVTTPSHMVEYYLRVAEATAASLGTAPMRAGRLELVLPVNAQAAAAVSDLLERTSLSGQLLVGINPGAAYGDAKRWPLDQLATAAAAISRQSGAAIVSTAGPKERELNEQVAATAGVPIHCLGQELDLRGLVALVDRLALLITNDSGAMHISAARHTPTLAVFGPTDWNVTYPYDSNSRVVRESPPCAPCFLRECPIDHRCMTRVTADRVVAAATNMLAARDGQHAGH